MAMDASGAMEFLGPPLSPSAALGALDDLTRHWFHQLFGTPTLAQRLAWPAIRTGKNLLLCAPTGTGKTLAAFLPIVDRILAERATSATSPKTRSLYVTPLKALGNDVVRGLSRHAQEIQRAAPDHAPMRIAARTGDTSTGARRTLLEAPPDVLVITPESLAILLTQPCAAECFRAVASIVVDEAHSLAGNKRGADLSLSLERLDWLIGRRAQRIGLSATCIPLVAAARFLVGCGRPCALAHVPESIPALLAVELLEGDGPGFMTRLVDRLVPEIASARTTLVFTNVRSLTERLVWALRQRFPAWTEQIAAHHSSVSKERRAQVEARLKEGGLRVVVTSTSLELGIDIGTVDRVVLVHPPHGVARLLQRIGRSGHGPGRTRQGLILTSSVADLLEATVTAAASQAGQCEPLEIPAYPLDVLCQHLLGMAAHRAWHVDDALALVRQAYPYRDLARADFDRCLDYLSGRRKEGAAWLPARLSWNGPHFSMTDDMTRRIVRRNIGTIVADGATDVRLRSLTPCRAEGELPEPSGKAIPSASLVGQVGEPFADRLRPGDRFLLDGRCLEVCRREAGALVVDEVIGRPTTPCWGGDGWPLTRELARQLFLFRKRAAEVLQDGPFALARMLQEDYGITGAAAGAVIALLQRQECVSEVPDEAMCLIESVPGEGGTDYYIHTPLGRAGNDALARVLTLRFTRDRGWSAESLIADLGLALFTRTPSRLSPADFRELLGCAGFQADLTTAIGGSDILRERFRRVALTGLMLLRNPLGARRRVGGADWAGRRLFEKIRATEPDFALLRQAEREVRDDLCDGAAAEAYLRDLPRLFVRCRLLARVSPFAESWTQESVGPEEPIQSPAEALEALHACLVGYPSVAHMGAMS